MNVVLNVRCWQTGMGNGASHLIPVPANLSFQPGLGKDIIAPSQEISGSPEVWPVKEAGAQSETE